MYSSDGVNFTGREAEVAHLVARGRTNRQIASALGIAEKTVETYLRRIFGKTGLSSRVEVAALVAVAEAIGHGDVIRPPGA